MTPDLIPWLQYTSVLHVILLYTCTCSVTGGDTSLDQQETPPASQRTSFTGSRRSIANSTGYHRLSELLLHKHSLKPWQSERREISLNSYRENSYQPSMNIRVNDIYKSHQETSELNQKQKMGSDYIEARKSLYGQYITHKLNDLVRDEPIRDDPDLNDLIRDYTDIDDLIRNDLDAQYMDIPHNDDIHDKPKETRPAPRRTRATHHNYCTQKWSGLIDTLVDGDSTEFQDVIDPYTAAVKNTYTWRLEEEVIGWTLIREHDPISGMHALAYQNDADTSLVMIAIRGTQLGGTPIEEANDLCADWWLLERDHPMPDYCLQFTEEQIDYYQQLQDFIEQVDEVVSDSRICYIHTGHSLGALLAALVSSSSHATEPAIGFAVPGQCNAATWLDLPLYDNLNGVYTFYSEYDPITVLSDSWNQQTGTLCSLAEFNETQECNTCYMNPDATLDLTNLSSPCGECFMQMHIYAHYLDLIFTQEAPRHCVPSSNSCSDNVANSGAWRFMSRQKHWPMLPENLYLYLSITMTLTLTLAILNCRSISIRYYERIR